jgi:hypothetical protein
MELTPGRRNYPRFHMTKTLPSDATRAPALAQLILLSLGLWRNEPRI